MIKVFSQGEGLLLVYDDETKMFLKENATKDQAIAAIQRWCMTYGKAFSSIVFEKAVSEPEPIIKLAETIENTEFYRTDEFLKLFDAYNEDYRNTIKKQKNELDKANERVRRTEWELKRLEAIYKDLRADYFALEKANEELKKVSSDVHETTNSHAKMATESEKPANAAQTAQESPQAREKSQADKLSPEGMVGLKTQINAKFTDVCEMNEITEELADLLFDLSVVILREICNEMIKEHEHGG